MKSSWCRAAALTCMATVASAAEESFSKAVTPADYSAAGLEKLSPAELARLDALVRDFKSGALEVARREAAAAAAARATAEARATKAEAKAHAAESVAKARAAESEAKARAVESEAKKSDKGVLAKAKVMLTPGTQVEYATVESRIVGDFRGWEGRTLFTLENGQ